MTSREFGEWKAYFALEPWGDDWNQTRAIAAATIAPYSKRRIDLEKYFPNASSRQTSSEIDQALMAFANRHNARVVGRG